MMTRAEHIAVVPFRLAMRKSRRVNQPAAGELLHDRLKHSPTSATGTGWERTPWHATQRGVGVLVRGILDDEIALTPGNFFPVPVSIPLERHRSVVAGFHSIAVRS